MAAVRNRIAHAYFGIDDTILFTTIGDELADLLPRVEALARVHGSTSDGAAVRRSRCRTKQQRPAPIPVAARHKSAKKSPIPLRTSSWLLDACARRLVPGHGRLNREKWARRRFLHSMTSSAHARIDGGIVRPSALAALSPFGPHARSAISAILRNVNTRRRFASGSFAISASVSAIVVPYAWYVGISASGG